jgi:hypothetical protein
LNRWRVCDVSGSLDKNLSRSGTEDSFIAKEAEKATDDSLLSFVVSVIDSEAPAWFGFTLADSAPVVLVLEDSVILGQRNSVDLGEPSGPNSHPPTVRAVETTLSRIEGATANLACPRR